MAQPRDRDAQKQATRRKVYEAALAIFRRDGVEAARIEDIAELAGVSRGTFYFHFPTRQDVLRELLVESQVALAAELADLPADAPLELVLTRAAHSIATRWKDEPRLMAEVATIAVQIPRVGGMTSGTDYPALLALIPRMQAAMDAGAIDRAIPAPLLAIIALVNVFAALLAWSAAPVLDLDALLGDVVRFFLRATRPDR
jgi:AcrR family transcriptional regulator